MYKLYKTFNAKAKQLAKEQAKGGGAKDKVGGTKEGEGIYAPLKMTSTIQEGIKQFKVYIFLCNFILSCPNYRSISLIFIFSVIPLH